MYGTSSAPRECHRFPIPENMATPEEQEATMIAKLPETTGRSLEAWKQEMETRKLSAHGQIVSMLKQEHGVTHGYANLIANKFLKSDAGSSGSGDDLVAAQSAAGTRW